MRLVFLFFSAGRRRRRQTFFEHHARDNTETASIDRRRSVNLVRSLFFGLCRLRDRLEPRGFGRFEKEKTPTGPKRERDENDFLHSADDVNDDVQFIQMADTTPTPSSGGQAAQQQQQQQRGPLPVVALQEPEVDRSVHPSGIVPVLQCVAFSSSTL